MIIGSIILVLMAAGLLVVGLIQGPEPFYYASIVASVLAAFALVVGVRQVPAARMPEDDFDLGRGDRQGRSDPELAAARGVAGAAPRSVGRAGVPVQLTSDPESNGRGPHGAPQDGADFDGAHLAGGAVMLRDEPASQPLTDTEAATVAVLGTEIIVVDGRPRYHVAQCPHLLGRDFERLPVMEAIELGFTPCGQCEPATALLAATSRT